MGADSNACDKIGGAPISVCGYLPATSQDHACSFRQSAELLINARASINHRDVYGITPLGHTILFSGDVQMCYFLIKSHADMNLRFAPQTVIGKIFVHACRLLDAFGDDSRLAR